MSAQHTPGASVLNVLRVAIDRMAGRHRETGFHDYEIEIAKDWVASQTEALNELTDRQVVALEWFSAHGCWMPHREWRAEMTTVTARSLCKRGLLDEDHTKTTTHYRINNAGRAAVAKATGSALNPSGQSSRQAEGEGA